MGTPLQAMIVEDRHSDAELMVRELTKAGFDVDWQRVETEREFRIRLTPSLAVILVDYTVPGFGAVDALRIVREAKSDVPVIIVAGSLGDERAVECLKLGAVDYILKDRMARLASAVQRALAERAARREKAEADAALRRSEAQFRSILSTVEDVLCSISLPDGRLLYLSPSAEKLYGTPIQGSLESLDQLVARTHPDDRARVAKAVDDIVRWGTVTVPHRIVRPDGSIRHVVSRGWTAYDAQGTPIRMEGIVTDVTDRVKADEERVALEESRREAERLKQLNEFRSQFVSMVAHELNNPLTPIRLQLGLLQGELSGALTETQRKSLRIIASSAARLTALVADLLDAARLQSGKLEVVLAPVDLAQELRAVVEALDAEANECAVSLAYDLPPTLPVRADARRLAQVVHNLVGNALKFTPSGGKVTVAASAADGGAEFSVTDTGRGIAAEGMARLFQPFTKLGPAPQGKHTGTGLGLYICKGIVEQHGGRIWCESDGEGKGAIFRVRLPSEAPARRA